jgi:hypothetical protein
VRSKLVIPFLLAAAAVTGCEPMAYFLYVWWPGAREKKVKAEFAGLPGKNVVIVVYCDRRVQYEYPNVCLSLSSAAASQLAGNVKDVSVVDPRRVVKYQDGNIYWDEMDKTQLGKAFGADFVLFLSLVEYSTREPGSLNLYRGRIHAQASLYQTSLPEREARVWRGQAIRVVYPEDDPTGLLRESDRFVRDKTEAIFADRLAKKFYDHKVPIE